MVTDMYLEDFREIVENVVSFKTIRDSYTDNLREEDSTLCDFVIENRYNESVFRENDYLLQKLLGIQLYEDLMWYIYDWKPGYDVVVENVTYTIIDINSYMNYINNVYKLPMKPKIEE